MRLVCLCPGFSVTFMAKALKRQALAGHSRVPPRPSSEDVATTFRCPKTPCGPQPLLVLGLQSPDSPGPGGPHAKSFLPSAAAGTSPLALRNSGGNRQLWSSSRDSSSSPHGIGPKVSARSWRRNFLSSASEENAVIAFQRINLCGTNGPGSPSSALPPHPRCPNQSGHSSHPTSSNYIESCPVHKM